MLLSETMATNHLTLQQPVIAAPCTVLVGPGGVASQAAIVLVPPRTLRKNCGHRPVAFYDKEQQAQPEQIGTDWRQK
jgi:hypothetical protein